jgi:hypothetical protein
VPLRKLFEIEVLPIPASSLAASLMQPPGEIASHPAINRLSAWEAGLGTNSAACLATTRRAALRDPTV